MPYIHKKREAGIVPASSFIHRFASGDLFALQMTAAIRLETVLYLHWILWYIYHGIYAKLLLDCFDW